MAAVSEEPARTPDRRIRKTRAVLHAALIELLAENEYGDITVEQVIRQADVARATFYAHFSDKDELFSEVIAELIGSMIDRAVDAAPIAGPVLVYGGAAVLELFMHAEHYSHIYLPMLHGAAGGAPLQHFRSALAAGYRQVIEQQQAALSAHARLPLDVIVRSWVGEQLALTAWWLEERPPYSAADLTRMRLQLMTDGPLWARGLEPGQVVFDDALFEQEVARASSSPRHYS